MVLGLPIIPITDSNVRLFESKVWFLLWNRQGWFESMRPPFSNRMPKWTNTPLRPTPSSETTESGDPCKFANPNRSFSLPERTRVSLGFVSSVWLLSQLRIGMNFRSNRELNFDLDSMTWLLILWKSVRSGNSVPIDSMITNWSKRDTRPRTGSRFGRTRANLVSPNSPDPGWMY